MKLNRVKKIIPPALPEHGKEPENDGRLVWEWLASRTLHPIDLAVIETLLAQGGRAQGRPVSVRDLASTTGVPNKLVEERCAVMVKAKVLVSSSAVPLKETAVEEPTFFLNRSAAGISAHSSGQG